MMGFQWYEYNQLEKLPEINRLLIIRRPYCWWLKSSNHLLRLVVYPICFQWFKYIYISQVVSRISSINRIKLSFYWPGFWAPVVKALIFCTPFGLGCIGRLIAKTTGQISGESLTSPGSFFHGEAVVEETSQKRCHPKNGSLFRL